MRQIELYVPMQDNQGQNVPGRYWGNLEARLRGAFGGFTTYDGQGQWTDGRRIYRDSIHIYRIVCQDDLTCLIATIAHYVKEAWKQESVLYTVRDIQATFI